MEKPCANFVMVLMGALCKPCYGFDGSPVQTLLWFWWEPCTNLVMVLMGALYKPCYGFDGSPVQALLWFWWKPCANLAMDLWEPCANLVIVLMGALYKPCYGFMGLGALCKPCYSLMGAQYKPCYGFDGCPVQTLLWFWWAPCTKLVIVLMREEEVLLCRKEGLCWDFPVLSLVSCACPFPSSQPSPWEGQLSSVLQAHPQHGMFVMCDEAHQWLFLLLFFMSSHNFDSFVHRNVKGRVSRQRSDLHHLCLLLLTQFQFYTYTTVTFL